MMEELLRRMQGAAKIVRRGRSRYLVGAYPPRYRAQVTGRYNVEMIRDFLTQLREDVQSVYYSTGRQWDPDHAEAYKPERMAPGLSPLMKKYGASLTPGAFTPDLGDDEEFTGEQAVEAVNSFMRDRTTAQREHLERLKALEPLFEEALFCASQGGLITLGIPIRELVGKQQEPAEE